MMRAGNGKMSLWLCVLCCVLVAAVRGGGGGGDATAGRMYVAIAAPPGEPSFSRAFNKTLANVTQGYLAIRGGRRPYNVTLETLVVELPANGSFSSDLLERLCARFDGRHVVALLLIGDTPAAFTVSQAATYAGVPVLWAKGQDGFLSGFTALESNALEMHLAPTSREVVQALRGVLLQAHWHTYTLLADRAAVGRLQRPELWQPIAAAPLHPTLVQLPTPLRTQQIFRKLADISRSTRGVVVLMTNRPTAIRILEDAKRLNMLDGHFVWLWIDTYTNTLRNPPGITTLPTVEVENEDKQEQRVSRRLKRSLEEDQRGYDQPPLRDYLLQRELSDMSVNYLLKNDQFLLFNHRVSGVESSKIAGLRRGGDDDAEARKILKRSKPAEELPVGLLSLRSMPIKVDRHLVKGTVRLLISALRTVLEREPNWWMESITFQKMLTSCWKPQGTLEQTFTTMFGSELKKVCTDALAGKKLIQDIGVDKLDKSLVANFEILNLVPDHTSKDNDIANPINANANSNSTYSSNNATNNSQDYEGDNLRWKRVGIVSGRSVRLDTIVWPGGDLSVAALSTRARTVFRVVTALAPPFVMESELDEDGQCLRGLPCHRVLTADKDNLTLVFNEMEYKHRLEEEEANDGRDYDDEPEMRTSSSGPFEKFKYRTRCCYGLAMDLLENIAQELEFDFRLYIVADGLFGSKTVQRRERTRREVGKKFLSYRFGRDDGGMEIGQFPTDAGDDEFETDVRWNGIVGDLISGTAHMSFASLSVSSARSEVIDFSAPYFFSGVSFIAAPQQKSEIPLMAFLLPFSPELWIAIFTSLNITAIAVAIYEWLSPFGLNPWGRQRSKNFSMSSALWVMWGLLCGHLVAFKAPKSWPNKFLINVWGGFSVIFVASYTANIAALIAGLFFQNTVSNYHDRSLLSQKVGTPKASASEFYVQKANRLLWEHMHKYTLENLDDGIERLRNGSLDILIADTPILDYYRATDHGCKLQKIGDTINEDTYAIGMTKGFPLKDSISAVIAKYSSNGYMDILQEKWYGGLPCFKLATEIAQPRPLGVAAVTGVFILLGVGMVMGLLILLVEHLFFRYTLPILREKPKGSVWRSRNIMFFSQKLYRFINCVELVSPHHAARELVHTIRQGQITSLFQKSIKRKEHEQRRRRKSKAQFFEMIQEIRRQQQEEREQPLESVAEAPEELSSENSPENSHTHEKRHSLLSPNIIQRTFKRTSPKFDNTATHKPAAQSRSPTYLNKPLIFSPRSKSRAGSSSSLASSRRFSSDSVFNTNHTINRNAVGRRLSKDASYFLSASPPDMNSRRSSYLDIVPGAGGAGKFKSPVLSIENVSELSPHERKLSDAESIGRKLATLPKYRDSIDKDKDRLVPQFGKDLGRSEETLNRNRDRDLGRSSLSDNGQSHSYTNILSPPLTGNGSSHSPEVVTNLTSPISDVKSSDEEATLRNKQLHLELQSRMAENRRKDFKDKAGGKNQNPHIRIQVEDTSSTSSTSTSTSRRRGPAGRKQKRHQSLGQELPEPARRTKLNDQSKSLDTADPSPTSPSSEKCIEHNLPPAPPPPNCSPRNSNGRSPLERLSKDELVLLWRSSESELRSHLLKAIRDKDEVTEKPP